MSLYKYYECNILIHIQKSGLKKGPKSLKISAQRFRWIVKYDHINKILLASQNNNCRQKYG